MLSIDSLAWNDGADRYEATYGNSGGRIERQETHGEREHLKMLLISADGEQWHKPTLGLVDYDGSTDNNILRDDRDNPPAWNGRKHTTSSTPSSASTTRSATVRSTSITSLSPPASSTFRSAARVSSVT